MKGKKLLQEWVKALRSGKYLQGKGKLYKIDRKGKERYCCLGVLGQIAGMRKSELENNIAGLLPSEFLQEKELSCLITQLPESFDEEIVDQSTLAEMNDGGTRFKTIANLIESRYLNGKSTT